MKTFIHLVLATLLLACSSAVLAEQKKTLGDWDVHYMVVDTTFLTPEIAKANNIIRSKNRLLVNISVLDTQTQAAQSVAVMGNARDLMGATQTLSFKEVKEGKAIYYLATLAYDDRDRLRFAIDITQGNNTQTLKFEQTFYQ
ncbi:DUF4426 domain-containing protein [Aestuariibacter sp. AA17]|uniref:DUF4426 domain-containing protein n=1 Tax=Fluctibacter corallii TaxID=2984329 RepID=A0ABT3A552_9ALTE|nr:DUF4426 domain-containing protein [Aestuariibacter sp. AA17]MCV2883501.1 DUF4426 domain-containing protein [Aestuariibacter sp. AA17]